MRLWGFTLAARRVDDTTELAGGFVMARSPAAAELLVYHEADRDPALADCEVLAHVLPAPLSQLITTLVGFGYTVTRGDETHSPEDGP